MSKLESLHLLPRALQAGASLHRLSEAHAYRARAPGAYEWEKRVESLKQCQAMKCVAIAQRLSGAMRVPLPQRHSMVLCERHSHASSSYAGCASCQLKPPPSLRRGRVARLGGAGAQYHDRRCLVQGLSSACTRPAPAAARQLWRVAPIKRAECKHIMALLMLAL